MEVVISAEEFKVQGDYQIIVKAKGYNDKIFDIQIGKKLVEVPNFVKPKV